MNTSAKKILKIGSVSLFFLLIVIFGFFRSKDLIFGVKIKNVNIIDGSKVDYSVMKITGNARNATFVALNDREISINQAGNFDESFALLLGYNIINIKARDKFGYTDEKNYQIIK